jgi:hypothetical protein
MEGHGYGTHGGYENLPSDFQYSDNTSRTNLLQDVPHTSEKNLFEEIDKNSKGKCIDYSKKFEECMKLNFNNTSICSQAYEDLKRCQSNIL